ncbi:MAG: glycosyltransferase [Filifactoraceae bacterium]
MKDKLLKIILNFTDRFKPIIIKIIPIEILRLTKKSIINNYTNFKNYNREAFERYFYPEGINVIGAIKSEIGLGQSCRLLARAVLNTNLPSTIYNYKITNSVQQKDNTFDNVTDIEIKYNINIIHINPYDMPLAVATLGMEFWNKRYNIGYWLWELEEFPKEWESHFKYVDEIWTPSDFVSQSIRKSTNLPVRTIPYAIKADSSEVMDREYFNLPKDKFLFITMFDSNSTMGRKNPLGAINAYKQAFRDDDDSVGLIIKVNNGQKSDIQKIKELLIGYKNIFIIDKILEKIEVNSLIKDSDVLISLHRAEGYGLPIAEAMFLGTPTIATNWSSNVEFSSKERNCLVDYTLINIEEDYAMYKKGNRWADPDINHAAQYMVKLKNDKIYYNSIRVKAKEYMEQHLNKDNISKIIENRIKEILEGRG